MLPVSHSVALVAKGSDNGGAPTEKKEASFANGNSVQHTYLDCLRSRSADDPARPLATASHYFSRISPASTHCILRVIRYYGLNQLLPSSF
jgi:hypothetical protein